MLSLPISPSSASSAICEDTWTIGHRNCQWSRTMTLSTERLFCPSFGARTEQSLSPATTFHVRETGLCFALSAFFFPCFISLLLLVTVIPSLPRFPASRDEYHSRDAAFGFNTSSSIDMAPLSPLWTSYSPYHPAGEYEGSIREGRVATQVNIVSRVSFARRLIHLTSAHFSASFRSFNVTVPDTQLQVWRRK